MTTGALIFAFNNESTDYVAMAGWSAERIRRHLKIPTAIVTDADPTDSRLAAADHIINAEPVSGGTRWFADYQSRVTWHNAGRTDAYSLTPWDQTIVLDADYVVCGNELQAVIDSPQDFMCHRYAWDITNTTDVDGLNWFGHNRMPMWWATVMMFRKSNMSQYIFDSMSMVRANWLHYKNLYRFSSGQYRNDFALSIALGIVSGHTLQVDNIPFGLATILPGPTLKQLDTDYFEIIYTGQDQKYKTLGWRGMDFHAMGKKQLGDIVGNPC
jgi:hypothetical protein